MHFHMELELNALVLDVFFFPSIAFALIKEHEKGRIFCTLLKNVAFHFHSFFISKGWNLFIHVVYFCKFSKSNLRVNLILVAERKYLKLRCFASKTYVRFELKTESKEFHLLRNKLCSIALISPFFKSLDNVKCLSCVRKHNPSHSFVRLFQTFYS